MHLRLFVVFFLLLISKLSFAQTCFNWKGYGEGLSYLEFKKDKIYLCNSNDIFPLSLKCDDCISDTINCTAVFSVFYDYTLDLSIHILEDDWDSLRVEIPNMPHLNRTFYKKELSPFYNKYEIEELSITYISSLGIAYKILSLNFEGKLKVKNLKTQKTVDISVPEDKLQAIKSEFGKIDFDNFKKLTASANICNDTDLRFSFKTKCGKEFSYYCVDYALRPTLKNIYKLFNKLDTVMSY